jgi:ribosomal protein S12 methylthiotransferase accessory factor
MSGTWARIEAIDIAKKEEDTMRMEIGFPGGVKVSARFRGHELLTDQTSKGGGEDSAAQPFDLFLASIGTCAGLYALRFCQQRDLDTSGLGLTVEPVRDPASRKLSTITLRLTLPTGFPEKYNKAIVRAIDQCAVKRAILDPPVIETIVAKALA